MPYHYDLSSLEDFARDFTGNWRKFRDFGWTRSTCPDADQWGIFYTHNRDSDLLEIANRKAMDEELAYFFTPDDPDIAEECHGHFAVGTIYGFAVRVYDGQGKITSACRAFWEILRRLEAYPILDEGIYEQMQFDAWIEDWPGILKEVVRELDGRSFLSNGRWHEIDFSWLNDLTDFENLLLKHFDPMEFWNSNTRDFQLENFCDHITDGRLTLDEIINACFADLSSYRDNHSGDLFEHLQAS